jgi:ABC-type glycerol-3-phosphate transport system substrate-binding protein
MKKFSLSIIACLAVCSIAIMLCAGCKAAPGEGLTFTMFSADINPQYDNFQSPVAQKIKEATGVTLDMQYPVGDAGEKITLMLASGDYPDLVYARATSTSSLQRARSSISLSSLISTARTLKSSSAKRT